LAVGASIYAFLDSLGGAEGQAAGRELPEPKKEEPINVLLLGLDAGVIETQKNLPARSDTIMVATLDPEKNWAGVISIPRDSRVSIPGRGIDKINHAHAYGGTDLAIKTVEQLLNIPIHYYVKVDYQGLINVVDILGGVKINVEQDMKYVDKAGGLSINIKAGEQVLFGDKAEEYLRFRDKLTGDLGRIERQQKFIRALADQFFSAGTLLKIPELARVVSENVKTNLSPTQMVYYASLARKLDLGQVPIETLVGVDRYIGGISYYVPDTDEISNQLARVLRGIDREANKAVRIEVLNGNGEAGAASEVARQLSDMGYTVVRVGNAESFDYEQSEIISSANTPEEVVEAVAAALNVTRILPASDGESSDVDLRVILGQDLAG